MPPMITMNRMSNESVMLKASAEEINRSLRDPGVRAPAFKGVEDDDLEMQEELARFHLGGR